jgi:formylglycine-generating enzyme required for sulfatase activity
MSFRLIPAGKFRMGSRGYRSWEEPVHEVEIPEPFWMGETPVTQSQFSLWTKAKKIEHKNHFAGRPDHPAENMDWRQAVSFCDWLTRTKGSEFPSGFRMACLPTEAEWEYACRAGTETEYYTGDGEAALAEAGWFGEDRESGSTHPVKIKKANEFGLYDMHGNVWEWCRDVYDPKAYRKRADAWRAREWTLEDAAADADYWTEDDRKRGDVCRVLRGGSWNGTARLCRSAFRLGSRPVVRYWGLGFRVCLVRGDETGVSDSPSRVARPEVGGPSFARCATEGRQAGGTKGEGSVDIGDLARASFPCEAGRNIF